jgi:Flp pilus assembly pilin Flp
MGTAKTIEAASMKALVPVTIIIAIVGVVATVMDMINKIGDQKGAPFGCSSN